LRMEKRFWRRREYTCFEAGLWMRLREWSLQKKTSPNLAILLILLMSSFPCWHCWPWCFVFFKVDWRRNRLYSGIQKAWLVPTSTSLSPWWISLICFWISLTRLARVIWFHSYTPGQAPADPARKFAVPVNYSEIWLTCPANSPHQLDSRQLGDKLLAPPKSRLNADSNTHKMPGTVRIRP
jgi:hypothetical protein